MAFKIQSGAKCTLPNTQAQSTERIHILAKLLYIITNTDNFIFDKLLVILKIEIATISYNILGFNLSIGT